MNGNARTPKQQPLSAEAQDVANTYQLGTAQQEFKVGYSSLVTMAMVSGVLLAALAGFIGYEAYSSDPAKNPATLYWTIAVVVVGLLITAYHALYPVIYRSWHIYICSDGFVSTRWGKAKVFRWDQVVEVYNQVTTMYQSGIKTYTMHGYRVKDQNGNKLLIKDDYKRVEDLGNTLLRETSNVMLPKAIEAYNAGGMTKFGPIAISRQGLHKGNDILPWDQVKDIQLRKGMVTIDKRGRFMSWASIPVAKIANPIVFLKLLEIVRTPTPQETQA